MALCGVLLGRFNGATVAGGFIVQSVNLISSDSTVQMLLNFYHYMHLHYNTSLKLSLKCINR